MEQIIEQFENGNISYSCEQIEKYGSYSFFDGLRLAPINIERYIRMSLAFIFYMENKDN